MEGLQHKLECEDVHSLLRSSPDLRCFAVDAFDARMIASLYLHDLSGEANGKAIRCACCTHSLRSPPASACSLTLLLALVAG
jgi:hypothetical protein